MPRGIRIVSRVPGPRRLIGMCMFVTSGSVRSAQGTADERPGRREQPANLATLGVRLQSCGGARNAVDVRVEVCESLKENAMLAIFVSVRLA
mmetsp:Transcript_16574/g.45281  ORF Transcript_16574/g.45281 Transcript_16574/m.45281 type:complete len:92 (-) Transcript_16574:11-286(-)